MSSSVNPPDDLGPLFDDGDPDFAEASTPSATESALDRFKPLDWAEVFAMDFSDIDWLPGRFMERGQQVALVGDGKVGKTLFTHDWVYHAITGRSFLGDQRRDPIKVLYLDQENGLRDIVTRMQAFGAGPEDLKRLYYVHFPRFSGPLDSSDLAMAEFFTLVDHAEPDLIVLDTVSRFIGGKENDSDTWLALYRRIHVQLKNRGVACVRLDHMGKDSEKGSRGSSAKSQDVDHVWELSASEPQSHKDDQGTTLVTGLKMKRTHTRTGLGDDEVLIVRKGRKNLLGMWAHGGTSHGLLDPSTAVSTDAKVQGYVDGLVYHEAPAGLGRGALSKWCNERGVDFPGNKAQAEAVTKAYKIYLESRRQCWTQDPEV